MAIFLRAGKDRLLCRLKSTLTTTTTTTTPQVQKRLSHSLSEGEEGELQSPSVRHEMDSGSSVPEEVRYSADMSKWKKVSAYAHGIDRKMIPSHAWTVMKILQKEGFQAYLVGGCVRDLLLKRVPKDFDVITTATLKQINKQFRRCDIIGQRFPICRVRMKRSIVEVSSFDTVARDAEEKEKALLSQIPRSCDKKDFLLWRNSMHRDFTINSLFLDPFSNQIYDYANGIADIRFLKLETIIPAELSFKEDCARILRGLRIAGRLGLSISKEIETAIQKLSSSLMSLDKFRMMMEMNYMLAYGAAESTIHLLHRFNLLQMFLPFHAAYLDEQTGEKCCQSSTMLMKLLYNLDMLVGTDRPCDCCLWIGLLAFHQALVMNPQDALVVWAFAAALYHGKWKDGVKFARENANLKLKFVPEFSGLSEFSDEELEEEVTRLASLVQHTVVAMMDGESLLKSQSKYTVDASSGLVFLPKRIGARVAELFDVLVNEVESYEVGRKSFMIDYYLLGIGNRHESRFVLGKVILETLSGGLAEGGMGIALEEEGIGTLPRLVNQLLVEEDKKCATLESNTEPKQEMDKIKKQKLVQKNQKDKVVLKSKSLEVASENQKQVASSWSPEGDSNASQRSMSGDKRPNLQGEKRKHRKDASSENQKYQDAAGKHMKTEDKEAVKEKPVEHKLTTVKQKLPLLSDFFRSTALVTVK